MIPFLASFRERYGTQSEEVVADSGYGSEENYAYMADSGMDAYVKYPMFHAEIRCRYADNAFLVRNMYYNAAEGYYVCPMGQHMERCGTRHPVSDPGYRSEVAVYRFSTARDARSGECATKEGLTGEPWRLTTWPTGSRDRQGSCSPANAG